MLCFHLLTCSPPPVLFPLLLRQESHCALIQYRQKRATHGYVSFEILAAAFAKLSLPHRGRRAMHQSSQNTWVQQHAVAASQEINDPSNPSGGQGRALERVMLPVSGLASWVVVCAGSLMCLAILGINVQPLLTVGGVSTVLVGLSAQSVLANLISGINLVRSSLLCSISISVFCKESMFRV